MTTKELKDKINIAIDSLKESELKNVLEYLTTLQNSSKKSNYTENLEKILTEDAELLKKLAQ